MLPGLTVGLEAVQVAPAEGHVEQRVRPGEGHAAVAVVQLRLHALQGAECPSLPVSRSYNTHSDDVGKTPNCPDCDRVPRPLSRTAWTEEGEGSAAVLSLMWSKIQQQRRRRRSKFSKQQDECSPSVHASNHAASL